MHRLPRRLRELPLRRRTLNLRLRRTVRLLMRGLLAKNLLTTCRVGISLPPRIRHPLLPILRRVLPLILG